MNMWKYHNVVESLNNKNRPNMIWTPAQNVPN